MRIGSQVRSEHIVPVESELEVPFEAEPVVTEPAVAAELVPTA
jgi:hypothetical protein